MNLSHGFFCEALISCLSLSHEKSEPQLQVMCQVDPRGKHDLAVPYQRLAALEASANAYINVAETAHERRRSRLRSRDTVLPVTPDVAIELQWHGVDLMPQERTFSLVSSIQGPQCRRGRVRRGDIHSMVPEFVSGYAGILRAHILPDDPLDHEVINVRPCRLHSFSVDQVGDDILVRIGVTS